MDLYTGDLVAGNVQPERVVMKAVHLNYGEQDVAAQGNLTNAVFDWLDDENKVHPTHLKTIPR